MKNLAEVKHKKVDLQETNEHPLSKNLSEVGNSDSNPRVRENNKNAKGKQQLRD